MLTVIIKTSDSDDIHDIAITNIDASNQDSTVT